MKLKTKLDLIADVAFCIGFLRSFKEYTLPSKYITCEEKSSRIKEIMNRLDKVCIQLQDEKVTFED